MQNKQFEGERSDDEPTLITYLPIGDIPCPRIYTEIVNKNNLKEENTMKTKMLVLTTLIFLLTACGMDVTLNTSANQIADAASEIADFDLPDGYKPEFTASLNGYTVVSYTPGDGASHLYLVQSRDAADAEKLAQAMKDIVPGEYDPESRMAVLETRPINVRGEQTMLVLSEGSNGDGESYSQAMVAFEGNGGPALVVFSTPVVDWNIETVNTLFASIR